MVELLAADGSLIDHAVFMYSVMGILASAFFLMVILYWKKDRKTDNTVGLLRQVVVANIEAVDEIKNGDKRLEQMLECVQQNSEAMTGVKMAVEQNSQILQRLNIDYNAQSEALAEAVKAIRSNGHSKS